MKISSVFSALLVSIVVPGLADDAVWTGASDSVLNNADNWDGNPFYDAETNPDTPLCFNASADTTLTADMTAYMFKFGCGSVALGIDLGGKMLHLKGAPVDWNSQVQSKVTFKDGDLLAKDEAGNPTQMTIPADSTVVLDNVDYTGNLGLSGKGGVLIVTNGAQVTGGLLGSDYASFSTVVVAGKETVWDFNQYALRFGARYGNSGKTNALYVTDGAVVTNFGNTVVSTGDTGYRGFGPISDGSVFEFSKGARAYANANAGSFSMCNAGGSNSKLRVLSGAKLWLYGLGIGRADSGHSVEVAGKDSLLYCYKSAESASVYFGYRGSRCRLWAHDYACVTNMTSTYIDGYFANETKDARLDVTDHAEFYSSAQMDVGRKQGYRCGVSLDNGAKIVVAAGGMNVGVENFARTNSVSVGNESQLSVCGAFKFYSGADGRFVVSNGTVDVKLSGNICGVTFGNGTEILLAGLKPRVACERSIDFATNILTFDVPVEGYDSSDGYGLIHCGHTGNYLNVPSSVTPVFKLRKYIRNLDRQGARMTLLSAALGPINNGLKASFDSAQLLAKWQKILDDEYGAEATCTLSYDAKKTKMFLDVRRKYGLMLLVK